MMIYHHKVARLVATCMDVEDENALTATPKKETGKTSESSTSTFLLSQYSFDCFEVGEG